jgi:hypothetical protein
VAVVGLVGSVDSEGEPTRFGPPAGETRATQSRVLKDVVMIAGVIFLTLFFALGTLLVLLVHQGLLADDTYTRSVANAEPISASREGSPEGQLHSPLHDHAA